MKTYDLYLDSGPMKKSTYIHVPSIAGCIARGPRTDEALVNAPAAIRGYLRFLALHGKATGPDAAFRTRVAAHATDGGWPGNGAGFLATDTASLSKQQGDVLLERLGWIHDDLRKITVGLSPKQLDAKPAVGRPLRKILQHLCGEGGYLRGVSGASRIQREAEEGRIDARDALDRLLELETARLHAMTKEERSAVIPRGQSLWSVRAAVRRMLEHAWEHYSEIAVRLRV
ncbi:MAG: DinB family protein [Dehalococcoidia bacterium]